MMKKIFAALQLAGFFGAGFIAANAQTAQTAPSGVGVAASGQATVSPASPISAPAMIYPPYPGYPPSGDSGFIQFNNLTIESVSGTSTPVEIIASNGIYPMPMMGATGTAAPNAASPMGTTGPQKFQIRGKANTSICFKFKSRNAAGKPIACPSPAGAPGAAGPSAGANIAYPNYYRPRPYRIEIDASTRLILRDRTSATLDNFSAGDQINVFGYYNSDGTVQAYLIRNISKPPVVQTLQLNDVRVISISGNSVPTTITVADNRPCYAYGANGYGKAMVLPGGPATKPATGSGADINIRASKNPAMAPYPCSYVDNFYGSAARDFLLTRNYAVTIDAKTVLLDRAQAPIQLAALKVGDSLAVYGESSDNGATINADLVRDLSIPPLPADYSGTVSQVNTDGSFTVKLDDGRLITVPNPVAAGAAITVHGLLDASNTLSQIDRIFIGGKMSIMGVRP